MHLSVARCCIFSGCRLCKKQVGILTHGSNGELNPSSETTAEVLPPHFLARKHHSLTLTKLTSAGQHIFAAERHLRCQDLEMKMFHEVGDFFMKHLDVEILTP